MNLDISILYFLYSFAGINSFIDGVIVFRAEYLPYLVGFLVAVFPLSAVFKKYRPFLRKNIEMLIFSFGSALVSRFLLGEFIRFFYNRPRPFAVLSNIHPLVSHESGYSFPSGHALFFFALAAGIAYYYPRTSILFFLAAFSIGMARVSAGIHWPSDILAGAALGVLTTLAVRFLFLLYRKNLSNKK